MIAMAQTTPPQPRRLLLPCSPDVMRSLMAQGWSREQALEHVEMAANMGREPLSLCPSVHARVFDG